MSKIGWGKALVKGTTAPGTTRKDPEGTRGGSLTPSPAGISIRSCRPGVQAPRPSPRPPSSSSSRASGRRGRVFSALRLRGGGKAALGSARVRAPARLARSPPLSGPSRDSVRLPPPSRGWERGVGPGQVPAGREAQGTPPRRAPPASAPLRKSRFKTAGTFFSFFGTARFQQWLCAWSSKYGDFSEARSA